MCQAIVTTSAKTPRWDAWYVQKVTKSPVFVGQLAGARVIVGEVRGARRRRELQLYRAFLAIVKTF